MTSRTRFLIVALIVLLFSLPALAKKKPPEPLATLNFVVVRDENEKPVRNAAVVLHPVDDEGNQTRGGLELKTNPEGKASYEGVPYGKLRIQVLAPGFQTYGGDYEINQESVDITVKLKKPTKQYSIYEDHPKQTDQKPPDAGDNPPQK